MSRSMLIALWLLPASLWAQPTDTGFEPKRGLYAAPIAVALTADDAAATIRYTTDGSAPTRERGTIYAGPVPIERTTVLRAMAYGGGGQTNVDTHTYIFPADVVRQPRRIDGWPTPTLGSGRQQVRLDYEMDPEIRGRWDLEAALRALPSVSVVAPRGPLMDAYVGNAEIPASVEFIDPERPGRSGQEDGGVEGHSHQIVKRSLRLSFKPEYGAGSFQTPMLRDAALDGRDATEQLDRLVLRAGTNRSVSQAWNADDTAYARDSWARHSQLAMSGIGLRDRAVHVYLNGVYFGVYEATERADGRWRARYFGGDDDDYFTVSHSGAKGGDAGRWNHLRNELANRDLRDAGPLRRGAALPRPRQLRRLPHPQLVRRYRRLAPEQLVGRQPERAPGAFPVRRLGR